MQFSEDSLDILVVNIWGRACGEVYSNVLVSECPIGVKIEGMPIIEYVLDLRHTILNISSFNQAKFRKLTRCFKRKQ